MMKKLVTLLLSLSLLLGSMLSLCACGRNLEHDYAPKTDEVYVRLEVKKYGTIDLCLDRAAAPITVDNFVALVEAGFYDKLTFHRVIDGFMIQGGDPNGDGTGGSTPIKGEFLANGYYNPINHERGTISMARLGNNYDSGSCQFFIVHETSYNNSYALDGQYAAFGRVVKGMEVVDAIVEAARYASSDDEKNGTVTKPAKIKYAAVLAKGEKGDGQSAEVTSPGTVKARMTVKDLGVIDLELNGDAAPITVTNFKKLVEEGFYDGLTFHRVIDGFMIQGGDPNGNGSGGSTPIKGEFAANGYNNPIQHVRGTISMARRGNSYDSGSCQFFIVHETSYGNSYSLDGQYAAFGHVTSGMEVVDAIVEAAQYATSSDEENGIVTTPAVIESIVIVTD